MRTAIAALLQKCRRSEHSLLKASPTSFVTSFASLSAKPFQVRSVSDIAESHVVGSSGNFDEMLGGTHQKYYVLCGKGGVGKTSCAASLAVKFANHGHPTMVVSTDPAHSLSDSFAQDLTGGSLVPVQGVDSPLYALEISPEKSREEIRAVAEDKGGNIKDAMSSMGLGMLADQFGDLNVGDLLDSLPPGFDEAIAIQKVMQFVKSQQYSMFTRIVFDTAPTGHMLRLLSMPDFVDSSVGKMLKLKKLSSAVSSLKSVFGKQKPPENALDTSKLEELKEKMAQVRDLFRNPLTTEFIIVTIPTVMAINESSRLEKSLTEENVPVRRLVVNQVLPESASVCKFCSVKRKDQMRAIAMIQNEPGLARLSVIQSPMVDVEIRGVPALKFMGDTVWR